MRYHSLDSLRGIAAMQVVIGHCLVALPALAWFVYEPKSAPIHDWMFYLVYSPLHILCTATPAVKLFFVLSGFVLSLPYYSEKKAPYYPKFFVKRIIRLYLPCFVVISLSLLLKAFIFSPGRVTSFGDWIIHLWSIDLSTEKITKLYLMSGDFSDVNPALWTIPPEIKLSLILPVFVFLWRGLSALWSVISIFFFIAVITVMNKLGVRDYFPDFTLFYYFSFFLTGSVMCKYRSSLIAWINNIPNWAYVAFIVSCIYIFTYNYSLWYLPIPKAISRFDDYISGFASIGFIMITLSDRASKFFNSKLLMFLGKISFSIYLTHILVIAVCAYLLGPFINPYLCVMIGFAFSFPVAILFYHFVEVPSLNLANTVSNYLTSIKIKSKGEEQYVKGSQYPSKSKR